MTTQFQLCGDEEDFEAMNKFKTYPSILFYIQIELLKQYINKLNKD